MRAVRAAPLLLALPLAWLSASAAEPATLYVVEQVVVNVNSAPDASGERIATVKSGEALQVIEKSGEQVHVKLANGKDGWVRAGYLQADEPLKPRLAQREAEVAQLKDELARLQGQLAAAHSARPAAAAPPPRPPARVTLRLRPPRRPRPPRRRCSTAAPKRRCGACGRGRSAGRSGRWRSASCWVPWCSTVTSAASTAACASTDAGHGRGQPTRLNAAGAPAKVCGGSRSGPR